jgi:diguanylate cyclase (GGDEF)-like protein
MSRISATIRITIGLALSAVTALLVADSVGLVPDAQQATVRGRAALCEAVAVNCSTLISLGNTAGIEASLKALVERNDDVLSAALRRDDGSILVEVGQHGANWQSLHGGHSTASQMLVPIYSGERRWGTVEVRFKQIEVARWTELLRHPLIRLVLFFAVACFGVFFFYLRKMLQHLDPAKVIPERVRAALDALAEGLVVVDHKERIVLANQAFATRVSESATKLQGRMIGRFDWKLDGDDERPPSQAHPWSRAIQTGRPQLGQMLRLSSGQQELVLLVNASPVLNEEKKGARGALVTFEDVTPLKEKQAELVRSLAMLDASREEVKRQNEELRILATSDPLTQCMNRRSFFERFERIWAKAEARGDDLAVIMIDIDHFKSFNDDHGHAFGDRVLRHVAGVVRSRLQQNQLVCRFGGEEFCVLAPDAGIEAAGGIAESLRQEVERQIVDGARVTASLGVSSKKHGAGGPEELLEQADKCLYVSKRNGRNRVTLWSDVAEHSDFVKSVGTASQPTELNPRDGAAPVYGETTSAEAVAALLAALNDHDQQTASDLIARLAGAADQVGEVDVSRKPAALDSLIKEEPDLRPILLLAQQLLELRRSLPASPPGTSSDVSQAAAGFQNDS